VEVNYIEYQNYRVLKSWNVVWALKIILFNCVHGFFADAVVLLLRKVINLKKAH